MDWSSVGDAASRILTVGGAVTVSWLTARQATKAKKVTAEARNQQVTTQGRLAMEDEAYEKASGYLKDSLTDARRELDDCRREWAQERQAWRKETAELKAQLHGATVRADRAEQAARAMARRTGQPEPDL